MPTSANCGSLTVEGDFSMDDVNITNCPTPVPSNASADQQITVEPSIENTGSSEANYEIYVLVGDVEVASDSVVTYAGTTTTIPLRFVPADYGLTGGDYPVEVKLRDLTIGGAAPIRSSGCESCGDSVDYDMFDTVMR